MGTFTITASSTGFRGDAPVGLYVGYPIEFHSTGGGYGGYYPDQTWISTYQGAFFTLAGTTTLDFLEGESGGGVTFSMQSQGGTFYRPNLADGTIEQIGTVSFSPFSTSGTGNWYLDGNGALRYDLYASFGDFMASLDFVFKGSNVQDFIEGEYVSGVGHTATFNAFGGDDWIFGSMFADNIIYAGAGNDNVQNYTATEVVDSYVDGGSGDDVLYVWALEGSNITMLGGAGNDTVVVTGGTSTLSGGAGDDHLQAETSEAVATYSGKHDEYAFFDKSSTPSNIHFVVEDHRGSSPDGTDQVFGIEWLRFSDGLFHISQLLGNGVTVVGTSGSDIITPTRSVPNQPKPSDAIDTIYAGPGNDKIDGGGGADIIYGGSGNDTYWVDNVGDQALEVDPDTGQDAGGVDLVYSSVTFTIAAFVENLTLNGNDGIDGTGNGLANKILGNSGNNGLVGKDGNDVLSGDAGADQLYGDVGVDTLNGGADADTLFGGAGADKLDGGTEGDTMYGGADNDIYYVDNLGDSAIETSPYDGANEGGIDLVNSSVSFALGSYLENLTLTSNDAIDGTGNELANKITGNAAANTLTGGGGNDTLSADAGADTLYGDDGNDTLSGGADGDTLFGGIGADKLDGGTEADIMHGGANNDTYVVDNAGDQVIEANQYSGANEGGIDLVNSSVSFALGSYVENLTLTDNNAVDGTGNQLANKMTGNAAANTLTGGGGTDQIDGAAGNDYLRGDAGIDKFVFSTTLDAALNADTIADFVHGTDKIVLSKAIFAGIGTMLDNTEFKIGAAADNNDFITYNSANGQLFYDAGGNTGAGPVLFATIAAGTVLDINDFVML